MVRKMAKVRVTTNYLELLLKGDWSTLCKKTTAPADLKVVAVDQPSYSIFEWFYVVCESDTFAPIPEGAEVPEVGPFEYTDARGE